MRKNRADTNAVRRLNEISKKAHSDKSTLMRYTSKAFPEA